MCYPLPPIFRPNHHPLPPKWDGHRIDWGEWELVSDFQFTHLKSGACQHCGHPGDRATILGLVRAPKPFYLVLFRCLHCDGDEVISADTFQAWVLGPEDYGPEGSTEQEKKE